MAVNLFKALYSGYHGDYYLGLSHMVILVALWQGDMATMHDVMDAQWMLDNYRDGMCVST